MLDLFHVYPERLTFHNCGRGPLQSGFQVGLVPEKHQQDIREWEKKEFVVFAPLFLFLPGQGLAVDNESLSKVLSSTRHPSPLAMALTFC